MAAVATSNSVIERGCLSRKTVNGLGVTFNEAVADTSMDFGRRMLAKFGWTEGKGLGRQENGMVDHIRVKQRADQLGLGAQEREVTAWAPPPDAIAAASKAAKKAASKKAKAKAKAKAAGVSDSDSESEGEAEVRRRLQGSGVLPGLSDDALFELCGGVRLHRGSRGGTGAGKLSRTEEADRAFLAKYGDAVSGTGGGSGGGSRVEQRRGCCEGGEGEAEGGEEAESGGAGADGELGRRRRQEGEAGEEGGETQEKQGGRGGSRGWPGLGSRRQEIKKGRAPGSQGRAKLARAVRQNVLCMVR